MLFNIITWDATPEIITGWSVPNWYGLSWAFSFILGYQIIKKIFKKEQAPDAWTDKVLFYVLIAGILGARLGHVFFYDWDQYKDNLGDIFKIWEGGLASHGGAIGILIALFVYSKVVTKKKMIWILDRVVITVAIAACLIRLGNLVNHEIVGHPSDKGLAMVFTRSFEDLPNGYTNDYFRSNKIADGYTPISYEYEQLDNDSIYKGVACPEYEISMNFGDMKDKHVKNITEILQNYAIETNERSNLLGFEHDTWQIKKTKNGRIAKVKAYLIPRHPAQLYESISYLLLFLLLAFMYWKRDAAKKEGLLFGTFLVVLFGARFFIEFIKVKQTDITDDWSLNMGHLLSVPFIAIGLFFIIRALVKKPSDSTLN